MSEPVQSEGWEPVTISQARTMRLDLEDAIRDLIRGFEESTGARVESIELVRSFVPGATGGGAFGRATFVVAKVTL